MQCIKMKWLLTKALSNGCRSCTVWSDLTVCVNWYEYVLYCSTIKEFTCRWAQSEQTGLASALPTEVEVGVASGVGEVALVDMLPVPDVDLGMFNNRETFECVVWAVRSSSHYRFVAFSILSLLWFALCSPDPNFPWEKSQRDLTKKLA